MTSNDQSLPHAEVHDIEDGRLPEISHLKNGGEFSPNDSLWQLKSGVQTARIDFTQLEHRLLPRPLLGYKKTLEWFARHKSLDTVTIGHRAFLAMIANAQTPVLEEISDVEVLGYLGSTSTPTTGWSILKTLLNKWHEQRNPGLSPDVYLVASKAKTAAGQGERDQALLTLCPISGPFSSIERDAFHQAYSEAFANGAIGEAEYIALTLERVFGVRPAQLAQMKVRDLESTPNNGLMEYVLSIPSAKKTETARKRFKKRLLIPEFGDLIKTHCDKVVAKFAAEPTPGADLPMFPMERVMPGHVWSPGFEWHKTSGGMASTISNVESKITCVSERTGEQMHINARRFRYTLGTVLAEEGHPISVIAEALDHEGIDTVTSYVALTGKLHGRLNKAMAMQLVPLAQAFQGMLVDKNTEAAGRKTVRDIRVAGTFEPVGNCGKASFCHYSAPVACYTCKNFRPFIDAPHEPLLDYLLAERERILARDGQTLAATEDRTIIAIADVLARCKEAKNG